MVFGYEIKIQEEIKNVRCPYPRRLYSIQGYPDGLEVPCGKCFLCRQEKSKEWSLRMYHELSITPHSSFITLTYDDYYLPPNGTLVKEDAQKFMKRLRKSIEPKKIRYFLVGEYGEKTQRPHYHAILYGHGLSLDERYAVMNSWSYCDWHQPSIRQHSFGLVEPASIQYVAGYCQKKLYGEEEQLIYKDTGRINPFKLCSQGIGRAYADQHQDILQYAEHQTIRGMTHTMPRYYIKRLNLDVERLKLNAEQKDCEKTESLTGIYVTGDQLYKSAIKEVSTYVKSRKKQDRQRELNAQAKASLNKRSL